MQASKRAAVARVRISGAIGDDATKVNGEYVVVGERVNGAPAYQKQGDANQWLCNGPAGGGTG